MTDSQPFSSLIAVNSRFSRSASITRDEARGDALEGYILTPNGRDILRRLAISLRGESSTRAWSLTGPYGSGKSSLALLAAQLLSGDDRVRLNARKFLGATDPELTDLFFGPGGLLHKRAGRLFPVLVTGSRQPLEKALATRLAASLRENNTRGPRPKIIDRLEQLAKQAEPAGPAIVELFEEANQFLERSGNETTGLLLIIDELGKFLEFGATNPEQGDIFVLQELAESATRSKRPFIFITILHQSLDRYVDHMSPSRRAEWAKVQGRFEDVAFEERSEQLLRLLTHAIKYVGPEVDLKPIRRQAKALAQDAVAIGVRAGNLPKEEMVNCLTNCYPLHPLTALVLGPLFRQLAQNERSLFAFLASVEPFGFQEFLNYQPTNGGAYRLDRLYDFVVVSLGPGLFAQHRGKFWSEVQTALDRLHDASEIEVTLAKTIGLIQAIGPAVGISASASTLRVALKGVATDVQVDKGLETLSRRSVVVFRRHTGSYALWEGSDVDIDDRLKAARQSVERDQNIAAFLVKQVPPQPLIARRHYFQTGTLRYFEAIYCGISEFQSDLFASVLGDADDADGRIIYCLPQDSSEHEVMRNFIVKSSSDRPILAVLPQNVSDLRELCHEFICLRWIGDHTPELEGDRTARRELHSRIALAEQHLRSHLEWLFSPGKKSCKWFLRGKEVEVFSGRHLNDRLSHACDEVYEATPTWRNELINRQYLSSSAAAARRNLIEMMLEHPDKEFLGLVGNPPERSIYETLLKGSRIHRKHGGEFGFYPPDAKSDESIRHVWKAMEEFLVKTDQGRKSVEHLFATLKLPPFGLKDGVLPVLLASLLLHFQAQVALYEEGSFVPKPTAAVFERLFRYPNRFELQRFRIVGPRTEVFAQYAAMIQRTGGGGTDLLAVVKPMVRLVKDLPEFVVKTKQISECAQKVLKTVREARQPDKLLFVDLPLACGFPAFEATGKIEKKQVEAYFCQLRSAFTELQRAYPQLISEIEKMIVDAFGQEGSLDMARKRIDHDARLVLNLAVESKLKAFLLRVADEGVEDNTWLESIATLLTGKPPVNWDDQDRARFGVQLGDLARNFSHYRILAIEMEKAGHALLDGNKSMLLVSITAPDRGGVQRVVQVPTEFHPQASVIREEVRRVLQKGEILDRKEVSVAILAELVRQLLSDGERSEK